MEKLFPSKKRGKKKFETAAKELGTIKEMGPQSERLLDIKSKS